jgi:DNA-binding NarL/FixJ family response regulator
MTIRLVLADDHPIVLEGLRQLLAAEAGFAVLAACADGEEALRAVREHRPDVLVLDLHMPKVDGLAVLRQLRAESLSTRVVILTASLADHNVLEAVRLGARGLVLKEMASELVVRCVRTVHAGGEWLERGLVRREAGAEEVARVLTPREIEIVRLVARGGRNKVIARELGITEGTVKIHLHNIYEKLGIESRTELALYAQRKSLI